MVANFWMITKGSLGSKDGDGNENENGKNVYINKTTLHVHLQLVPCLAY